MAKSVYRLESNKVRSYVKQFNKRLKEDCFAGRFELKRIGYQTYNLENGMGFPRWRFGGYQIALIDHEEPERNISLWCTWSDNFGLKVEGVDDYKYREYANSGLATVAGYMNNFIVKSDFWELWKNEDYKATHWYSGDELKRQKEMEKLWGNA